MVRIRTFCFNAFQENTHVIYIPGGDGLIIDPGNYSGEEFTEITEFIREEKITPRSIVNTHCHIDHVLGVQSLKKRYNVPFCIHADEKPVLAAVKLYAPGWGFTSYEEPAPDRFIDEGDSFQVGDSDWRVILLPGHSPGHIALYEKKLLKCIAGDIIFRNSIGRTDLPGGDQDALLSGIRNKLFTLPDEVEIFSGHGPNTTLGIEKKYNPYCNVI